MPFWFYFILTLVLELPLVLLFFRDKRWPPVLLVGFLLNLFTWPLLHVLLFYTHSNINLLEIGVAVAEGIGFWLLVPCRRSKGLLVGFAVNGFSYGVGLLLNL